jgi:hypothetical protein
MDEPSTQPTTSAAIGGLGRDTIEHERKEGLYRTIIQTSLDGFWVVDFTGRIVDANEAFCRMLGYTREELLLMSLRDVEISETPEETAAHIQKVIQTGRDQFQTRHRRRDGAIIDVEISVQYNAELGERFFSFSRDITGRKRAEDALRASNARFDLAIRGSNDGIWEWEIATNANYFSPRFLELLGYGAGELPLELATFEALLHPDDLAGVFERVRQHLEDKRPYDVEYRLHTKNGEYKWFRARGVAERDQAGKPLRMAGSLTDITERKQAEEKLLKSEAQIKAVLESLNESVVVLDTSGTVVSANAAATKLFGRTVEELIDPETDPRWKIIRSDGSLFPVEEQPAIVSLRTGMPVQNIEMGVPLPDGTFRWVLVNAQLIRDKAGAMLGVVASSFDITERKQAEEMLRLRALLLDSANDSIFVSDFDGNFVYLNEAAWKLRGYTREELMAVNLHTLDTSEYEKHVDARIRELVEKGHCIFESAHRCKDGSVMPVEVSARIIESAGRKLVFAATRDITERKRAEHQLARQLQELTTWRDATIGREMRILELKHEVNELQKQTGQPPHYPSAEQSDAE